jgi:hypothetical protein
MPRAYSYELEPDLTTPKPKKRKLKLKDGGEILLHPELPTRFEDVVDEGRPHVSRPTAKCDYLCKIGLASRR